MLTALQKTNETLVPFFPPPIYIWRFDVFFRQRAGNKKYNNNGECEKSLRPGPVHFCRQLVRSHTAVTTDSVIQPAGLKPNLGPRTPPPAPFSPALALSLLSVLTNRTAAEMEEKFPINDPISKPSDSRHLYSRSSRDDFNTPCSMTSLFHPPISFFFDISLFPRNSSLGHSLAISSPWPFYSFPAPPPLSFSLALGPYSIGWLIYEEILIPSSRKNVIRVFET